MQWVLCCTHIGAVRSYAVPRQIVVRFRHKMKLSSGSLGRGGGGACGVGKEGGACGVGKTPLVSRFQIGRQCRRHRRRQRRR